MLYKDKYLDSLIHSNSDEWDKMMNHKFVKEIANGSLKSKFFNNYLQIEHRFVLDAIDHMTMAMFYANKIEAKIIINQIITGLLNEQNNYFIETNGNKNDFSKIPEQANYFRNFMKNCAKKGFEEIIVSFLAAESMYNHWCSNELYGTNANQNSYSKWIILHTSEEFFNQVKFFSLEAKRINKSELPSKKQKELFRQTLIHEISFHNSIYG